MNCFSGDDDLPIDKWVEEFEEMGALLNCTEMQKLIYGKRLLKGSAKQFVSFERGITSWMELKRRLTREFKIEVNNAIVHSQLVKRHK